MRRLTVAEAAEAMGITTDAVRMRLSRGTLDSERQGGRVCVLLEDAATTDASDDTSALITSKDETIRVLREQLDQANEANRENRRIIAALTSRIPELPAATTETPSEPRGSLETVADSTPRSNVPGDHSETPEARAWRLSRLQEVLIVLIAIASLSALIYLAVTVLSS